VDREQASLPSLSQSLGAEAVTEELVGDGDYLPPPGESSNSQLPPVEETKDLTEETAGTCLYSYGGCITALSELVRRLYYSPVCTRTTAVLQPCPDSCSDCITALSVLVRRLYYSPVCTRTTAVLQPCPDSCSDCITALSVLVQRLYYSPVCTRTATVLQPCLYSYGDCITALSGLVQRL